MTTSTAPAPLPASTTLRLSARVYDCLALVVLAALAALAGLTFRDYGLGWDDYTHSQYGDLLLAFYTSGFTDRRALSFVNLYMYGGGFDLLCALVAKVLPFDLFETRRLMGALVGLVGLAVIWRIGRRLGGPRAGLFALILLATIPLYYGHMFMNAKDGPFAMAMAVLMLALLRAIQEYPAPSQTTVVFLGAAIGLVVGTRILGGIAVLFVVAPLAVLIAEDTKVDGLRVAARRFGWFILVLSAGLPIGYLVMALLWPWSVQEPFNPVRAISYFSHFFEKPWREIYDGTPILVPDMPATYVVRLLALKLPEVVLLLASVGGVGILMTSVRRSVAAKDRAGHLLVLSAALVPVIYAMISRPALYNGLRHFVFIIPAIAIVAGVAMARALDWLQAHRPAFAMASVAALAIGIGVTVTAMVRLHPYQYAYFNTIAGGVRGADLNYMLDYWGLAFKQATDKLRVKLKAEGLKPPGDRKYWTVAVCGPQRVAEVELGPKFQTTSNPRGADFALVLREFYCRDIAAPIVVDVIRDGVAFATVYDIRGRTVGNLSTTFSP